MPDRSYYLDSRLDIYREAYVAMARDIAIEFGAEPTTADNDTREMLKLEIDLANVCLGLAILYNK